MRSITELIVLVFVARVGSKDLRENPGADLGDFTGRFVDQLADLMASRTSQVSVSSRRALDNTTLGKLGQAAGPVATRGMPSVPCSSRASTPHRSYCRLQHHGSGGSLFRAGRAALQDGRMQRSANGVRLSASEIAAPGLELPRQFPASHAAYPGPLSPDEVTEFFEKGVVVVKGLLRGEQLERARQRTDVASYQNPLYEALGFDAWKTQADPFLEIATRSPMAEAAAQLTPNAVQDDLYVLKDAMFRSMGGNQGCGWHVDDSFFWPAAQQHAGPGVNVWVVLDEVTKDGGGLAVAPGSHLEEFLGARQAIQGGENGIPQTCLMADIAPEWNTRLEAMKEMPLLQPGDAIVMTRYMFHRAVPFLEGSQAQHGSGIARYSVRYVPGNARLDGGMVNFEGKLCALHGEIRDAAANGFPIFPQVSLQHAVKT